MFVVLWYRRVFQFTLSNRSDASLTPPDALGYPLGRGLFRFERYQCFSVIAFRA